MNKYIGLFLTVILVLISSSNVRADHKVEVPITIFNASIITSKGEQTFNVPDKGGKILDKDMLNAGWGCWAKPRELITINNIAIYRQELFCETINGPVYYAVSTMVACDVYNTDNGYSMINLHVHDGGKLFNKIGTISISCITVNPTHITRT